LIPDSVEVLMSVLQTLSIPAAITYTELTSSKQAVALTPVEMVATTEEEKTPDVSCT